MEWSFHYEGPVKDLGESIKKAVIPNEAMTQFKIVSAFILSETKMCEARNLNVIIHARGNEDTEDNTQRQLYLEIKGIK
jgi:hypothetical protein